VALGRKYTERSETRGTKRDIWIWGAQAIIANGKETFSEISW
jgi:hypothetical protein